MNLQYRSTTRLSHCFTAVASCLVTTVLFGAVVIGLTGEHQWGRLAQTPDLGAVVIASSADVPAQAAADACTRR